ncbi:MAG: hypothetical protein D4R65_13575 [Verrucomicrobiaceae bacterium]|nr:MAG: hypothetical protein D4R65_13575 [Verrucomicrobiaceae bacterium]
MKRKLSLLSIALAVIVCNLAAADTPQAKFQFLRFGEVQPRGWLQEQLQTEAKEGYGPHMDQLTQENPKSKVDLSTFDAAHKAEMEKSWWNGETTGNWLDGLIRLAYLSGDTAAKKRADEVVTKMLSFQEADGYLGMYPKAVRYAQPMSGQNGELWTQACLFKGLLAYYELTGRKDVLEAVQRAAKLTMSKYDKDHPYWGERVVRGGPGHDFMFVDVCEWLYRLTGDKSYADFAQFLYDTYNQRKDVFDTDVQIAHLANASELFKRHGAHVMEHLRVPLFVAYATGDAKYQPAVDNIFMKTDRHLTAGGACVSDEDILERLGNPDIGCEYCTMLELLNSLQSGLQKTGRADLADKIEVLAFNSAQGARLRDGKATQYCTRDNQYEAAGSGGRGARFKFSPTHEDVAVCCSPNAVKFFPYLTGGLWMKEASGLVATGYLPNKVETKVNEEMVTIETDTAYPFDDEVRMTVRVDKPTYFTLRLREPSWAGAMSVVAPGAEERKENGWRILTKEWKSGDKITISFAPEVVRKTVVDGSGIYWQRGPLVFSLPIASERTETKKYSVPGFSDWDYKPVPGSVGVFMADKDDGKFVLERATLAKNTNPWEKPPVSLAGTLLNVTSQKDEPVRLVPMGTTILRHTVFVDKNMAPKQVAGQAELLKSDANLARNSEVEVASTAPGYKREGLIDGVADGFPDHQTNEWSAKGGGVGTKAKLIWEMPEEVSSVWLFDRPNDKDHVLAARIKFSDGSTVEAGELPNDGKAPLRVKFSPRTINWMEVEITKVGPQTKNAGFSEIAVFKQAPAE